MARKYDDWVTPEGLARIEGWAKDGLIESQIAHNMGVSYCSFRLWKNKFPEIMKALKRGKEVPDREVENSLFKRAIGYTYEEVKITDSDKDGHKEERILKTVLPDVTACIFWLKNRKPDQWRDKNDLTLTPSNGVLESILELEKDKKE